MKKQYITKKKLLEMGLTRNEYAISRGVRHNDNLTHKQKLELTAHRKLLHKINEELYVDEKIIVIEDIDITIKENDIMKDIMKLIKSKYKVKTTCYGGIVCDVCFISKVDRMKSLSVIVRRSNPNELIYLASKEFNDIEFKSIFGDMATKAVPHMYGVLNESL